MASGLEGCLQGLPETKDLRTGLVHEARQALGGRALGAGVRRGERRHLVEALPQRRHVVLPQLAELQPRQRRHLRA